MQDDSKKLEQITFKVILREVQPSSFCRHDPLCELFLRIFYQNIWNVIAFAFTVYGIAMIGGGFLLSTAYGKFSSNFLSLFDSRELPIAIFLCPTCLIVLRLATTWHLRIIPSTLQEWCYWQIPL